VVGVGWVELLDRGVQQQPRHLVGPELDLGVLVDRLTIGR
jgi:hypothetical protein